ncbi:MAG: hypothetical protein AVDCRST_MAG20-1897 [uncultured Acidimicrobiales bacterium]|uniref:Uncharacterized protein n=1 Tax=uncultured Acidimicrobiales bacterium TaxID=310071 RepID=A0A6J4I706_9ACTN|nr:MAG: hypothetical protein AVDCRST_MAG20-1897 [uncultured Acidimicrobiales bacterium]
MDWERSFAGYLLYMEDLAGSIGGSYGLATSVAAGVHDAVLRRLAAASTSRRPPDAGRAAGLEEALARSWSHLSRAHAEVSDPTEFDGEANAILPTIVMNGVVAAAQALAVVTHRPSPLGGPAAVVLLRPVVESGALPAPWGTTCSGCPQTGTQAFEGLEREPRTVDVHARADPSSSEDRLAMFLRTTRAQRLEQSYAEARLEGLEPGRSRRNVSRAEKQAIADTVEPTTFFDILWRTRVESFTDGVDRFVVGATDEVDARRFAEALVIVADATVAAIEAVVAATVGVALLADMTEGLLDRSGIPIWSRLGHHASSFRALTASR